MTRPCLHCGAPSPGLQCERCRTGGERTDAKRTRKTKRAKRTTAPDPFPAYCAAVGLPAPVPEHRFCERRWRLDYAWPEHKVALEVEGGVWTRGRHTRGQGYTNDMKKYNRAALEGWTLIRRTPDQLLTGETLDMVRAAVERAA